MNDSEDYELTEYVVTRWYRAPEVMCACQEYDAKSERAPRPVPHSHAVLVTPDGLAAVLQLTCGLRAAFWPSCTGASRFSPARTVSAHPPRQRLHGRSAHLTRHCGADIHQMNLIFNVLGTPSEEDMKFITNAKAQQYIRSLKPREKVPYTTLYPKSNPLGVCAALRAAD